MLGASPASTDGLIDTVTAWGVVPLLGDNVTKSGPPLAGEAVTVKGKDVLELVTGIIMDAGGVVPDW